MKFKKIAGSFARRPIAVICLIFIVLVILCGVFAGSIAPNDPVKVDLSQKFQKPSLKFPFGTDNLGRCVFSRVIYGIRTSLGATVVVMTVSLIIGTVVGVYSGYKGGRTDMVLMRICDALLAFPSIVIVLLIVGAMGPGFFNVLVGMVLVQWIWYTRIVRSLVLSIKERTFINAAKISGTSEMGIIVKHILPNVVPQLIVLSTLDMGGIILHFSGYSFLGLGVQPPTPEWGMMIENGKEFIRSVPDLMFYPGVMITLVAISLNLIGDTLRDVLEEISP